MSYSKIQIISIIVGLLFSVELKQKKHSRFLLLRDDESLNFADYVYWQPSSLLQIELIKGFGPELTYRLINSDVDNLQDITQVKGIGQKRSEKLASIDFYR